MYNIIKHAHSGIAYLALIFLVIVVINAFAGMSGNKEFTEKDRKLGLFGLIFNHIQLLLGLILYFGFGRFTSLIENTSDVMKTSALRQFSLEHPLMMIISVVLITMGWSKHKKVTDSKSKFKKFAIFYTLGLILVLAALPWKIWFGIN